MPIIEGTDVSHHQHPDSCNWAEAAEAGLAFAWVKVSEGRDYLDPAAAAHLQRIAGLAEELHARGVLLWLVKYGTARDPSDTIDGWPWGVWQWSGGGQSAHADPWPGLPHPIDRNRYRGSLAELHARAQ